ncbi:probable glutamate receptor [Melitaea cinxia]|uniref:probable glutamate receptor n=1 Tax=Melitaea cinxia TaxID=113334 RepID=UPI001E27400C|nr:probable glutamate receptor [Melitaea cinxia]
MALLAGIVRQTEILLQAIITSFLNSSMCITTVMENNLILKLPNSFMSLYANSSEDLSYLMLNASEMGCSDYIVQLEEPKIFMTAFEKVIHMGNVRRSDRKIIILPKINENVVNTNDKEKLLNILSMEETGFVANVLLIVPSDENSECKTYDLITHKFVGPGNDSKEPLYLDKWNSCRSKFHKNVNLFPHDMSNLYGKVVKVAAFTYTPYVLLDLDTNIVPQGHDGIEMRIVEEFCRWVNCTIKVVREDEHQWGEIFNNRTGVGVIGHVFEDRAEIGITALYSWYEEYVALDFSTPILRTAITCLVPTPRLLASWEMPLLPFTPYMWIGIILTIIYASLALILAKGCVVDGVFLTTFGIMVTQSQSESGFSSWRTRSVVGWILITGLVLNNAYGGGLASTFTLPKYEPSIDTIQDLVDRELTWSGTHDAWIFSLKPSHEPLIRSLVSLFRTYPADELKRRSFTRNIGLAIEKLPADNFAIGDYITKEATLNMMIMVEEFYVEQAVVMLRKSSVYTHKISNLIGRLQESGLLLAWETQVTLAYLDYEVQLNVRLSRSKRDVETFEPLAMRHVQGIFIFYAIGITLSLFSFLMENFIHRKNAKKLRHNSNMTV